MRKIIISVAPTSAMDKNINPEILAKDVVACCKAGAGMVHMHVRTKTGQLTADISVFKEISELVRSTSDIVIQASTGGVSNLSIENRCAPLYYNEVESCSLNVGSLNLGDDIYKNPIKDVEYCCREIAKTKKFPEVEVFELGMIETANQLFKKIAMPSPPFYNIVLGHKGGAPATINALIAMRSFLPANVLWGITHAGRKNFDLLTAAVTMGASLVRIGFEDSPYLAAPQKAATNLLLVEQLVNILKAVGYEIASPKIIRELFLTGNKALLN